MVHSSLCRRKRQTDRQIDMRMDGRTYGWTDGQTDGQTYKTGRHTDRLIRQAARKTDIRQADIQAGRQI